MPTRDYAATVAELQRRGRFGIRLGVSRTRAILHRLGDPHHGLRGALIAGTNGKGSVQAMTAAVLQAAGYRVGQTPSPHLVSYRERIAVDGRPIAPGDFAAIVGEALDAADAVAARLGEPTEFEVVVPAALAWFARAGVDVAVVEVGMGGRLDATNAWDGGVAAVTNVALDHTDRLGATVAEIAREKAAIIKPGDRAVTGATGDALAVVRERAARVGAPLVETAPLEVRALNRFGLRLAEPALGELQLALLGRHQAANAAVALGVVRELAMSRIASVSDDAIGDGLRGVRWPGRLELLALTAAGTAAPPSPVPDGQNPDLILDGAHNGDGMRSLVAALDELRPLLTAGPPTILLGMMGDKDVAGILEPLVGWAAVSRARMVTTRVAGSRAMTASELAAAVERAHRVAGLEPPLEVIAREPLERALTEAVELARSVAGPLVVAGSLYLVGEVRGILAPDPDLVDVP